MKKLIAISFAVLSLGACKKDLIEKYETADANNTANVQKFQEIKASESFDWKTTKKIGFKYNTNEALAAVKSTLTISSLDGKVVFYRGSQIMNQPLELTLEVPATISQLKVTYGSFEEVVSANQQTISFTTISQNTNE